jgi:hypothetical protein
MREGDQRWLILWFGRRSWERWVVCGGCSGVWEKRRKFKKMARGELLVEPAG